VLTKNRWKIENAYRDICECLEDIFILEVFSVENSRYLNQIFLYVITEQSCLSRMTF